MKYILVLLLNLLCLQATLAQGLVPTIKTEKDTISIYIGGIKENFPHYKQEDPMLFTLAINPPDTISIVSETDSIAFIVKPKDKMIFDVVRERAKDTLNCFFNIVQRQEQASFSEEHKRTHQGKTFIEIPEVYELVNIIYAITPTGKTNRNIVNPNSNYYNSVIDKFEKYEQNTIVSTFDSLLQKGKYGHLKMDAYAFHFENHQIEKSKVYGGFWGYYNNLEPYVELLESFAKQSNFRKFYLEHQPFYRRQINTYRDSLDIHIMKGWLDKQFPSIRYDALKIIFSPLVGGNQSSWHHESNGFNELQAHVNYPYMGSYLEQYPQDVASLIRGNIVFTEINHGYINPESDKPENIERIEKSIKNLSDWIEKDKPATNYNTPYHCFNEYMNWGLVSLRYVDFAPPEYLPEMLADIENMMVKNRGFIKFAEFNQFLVKLYQERKNDKSLADMYPKIIDWFKN